ncbi:ABC transporter substrate-binding protein [Paenibacillus nasutitermitis]|uniref:Ferrichrome ABC transporter substrate-binding protein n=1 Tax=Paenibacillus nasutitermitis TaxID=1652958 RepID=A0A916Z8I0_9BACL|nr:ABC transporter substrate-binding protein [Paenibacillus nasutitermitis]GGD80450.1 ferrichrome ABC transporter substrate-binding protein [Paenibacillus nasutitermitis]
MFRWGRLTVWTAILMIAMLGLAACGTNNNVSREGAGQNNTETVQPDKAPESTREDKATRTVTDEFGEVEIPAHPQRVAGIYLEDYLKALGVMPVVQWYHPSWGKQDYLNLDAPQFDISGSLEALLDHNPDLIIVDGAADAAKYELYSKIAPTYRLKESILQDSSEILKAIADVMGIPEKGEAVLAEYEQKIADGKAMLQKAVGKEKVAVIRLNTAEKTIALFGIKNRFIGLLYNKFGLEPVPMVAEMEDFQAIISQEVVPELAADHIIVIPANGTWDDPGNQEAFKALEGPLWKNIPAIKNGNVYKMERSHWQSGAIMANSMKLDDLLKYMVN